MIKSMMCELMFKNIADDMPTYTDARQYTCGGDERVTRLPLVVELLSVQNSC